MSAENVPSPEMRLYEAYAVGFGTPVELAAAGFVVRADVDPIVATLLEFAHHTAGARGLEDAVNGMKLRGLLVERLDTQQ